MRSSCPIWLGSLLVLLLSGAWMGDVSAKPLFDAPYLSFDVSGGPTAGTVVDMDHDGRLDLVVATDAPDVQVLRGRGDGTFEVPFAFPTGSGPRSIAVADLNWDGDTDVVTANSATDSISVLLGDGSGGFRSRFDIWVGPEPYGVSIGDLDRDGRLDLVAAKSGMVAVVLRRADGTFASPVDYAIAGWATDVVLADLNRDGFLDVATCNYSFSSPTASVLLGLGDGRLGGHTDYPVGIAALDIATGYVNHDNWLDLVIANGNSNSNTVSVLFGNGDGTFRPQVLAAGAGSPFGVAVADLDHDGQAELLLGCNTGPPSTISVLRVLSNGGFERIGDFISGPTPGFVDVADLNSDGHPDVAAHGDNGVAVLIGNGDRTLGSTRRYATAASPRNVAIADLNGDGNADLAIAAGSGVSVLLGHGDGVFGPRIDSGSSTVPPSQLALGDLDGDGRLDAAVVSTQAYPFETAAVTVLRGNGNGTFTSLPSFSTGTYCRSLALFDFDGDASLDLAVTNRSAPGASYVSVLHGNGDGTFAWRVDLVVPGVPEFVTAGDVDEDGWLDIVVPNWYIGTYQSYLVSIFPGQENGTFGPRVDLTTWSEVFSVALGDVNGDTHLDLAIANFNRDQVGLRLGRGDGSFQEAVPMRVSFDPIGIAIADLDGVGSPDLAVASAYYGIVSALLSPSENGYAERLDFGVGQNEGPLAVGDLNHDGIADMVTASNLRAYVDVLIGKVPRTVDAPDRTRGHGTPIMMHTPVLRDRRVNITYEIAEPQAGLQLGIFDVRGRRLWARRCLSGQTGTYSILWDSDVGILSRGVYIVHLQSNQASASRKLTWVGLRR